MDFATALMRGGISGVATEDDPPTKFELADEVAEMAIDLRSKLFDLSVVIAAWQSDPNIQNLFVGLIDTLEDTKQRLAMVDDFRHVYGDDWRARVQKNRDARLSPKVKLVDAEAEVDA